MKTGEGFFVLSVAVITAIDSFHHLGWWGPGTIIGAFVVGWLMRLKEANRQG
jgi:hypothetical protein